MNKKEITVTSILAVLVTVMFISVLPLGVFIKARPFGLEDWMLPYFLNTALCIPIIFLALKLFGVKPDLGITKEGLAKGMKESVPVFTLYLTAVLIAIVINSVPFTAHPTLIRVILQCGVLYIPVAILEELLLRGLITNIFFEVFKKSEHRVLFAIIVSSALFAAGHVPSVIGDGFAVCLYRFIYPFGFGMFMGYIYKKTNNLLLTIIYHYIIDTLGEIPQVFSGADWSVYKPSVMIISSAISLLISVYSFVKARKLDMESLTNDRSLSAHL